MARTTKMLRVPARELRIHPIAQRRIIPATLKKIQDELDLGAIGVLHVVEYAIKGVVALWIIDGQHRHTALMFHDCGDWPVDVMLHTDVKDDAAASTLFLKLMKRAALNPFDRFANELKAGDPTAVGVVRIVKKYGLRIERQGTDGNVTCVQSLRALYDKDGGPALTRALETATAAWGVTSPAVEGKIIEGLGVIFVHYNGEVDQAALVKKLAKYPGGASGLRGSAKSLQQVRGGSIARSIAEVIVGTYNKGRRVGQLEVV